MGSNLKLKEAFEVEAKYGAFYTGGNVEWHQDTLFCQTAASVALLNIQDGTVGHHIGDAAGDDDHILTFTTDATSLITAHRSGLLKLWTLTGTLTKTWKHLHRGPVARLALTTPTLASGGADGAVRLWDLAHHICTASLKGCQGVVNLVHLHRDAVFASGDDGLVHSWTLAGAPLTTYRGHYSKVTALAFHGDDHLVTAGRDKVLILWHVGGEALRTVPAYEAVESLVVLGKVKLPDFQPGPGVYVASAGEQGRVRVWDLTNAKEVYKGDALHSPITQLLYDHDSNKLAVVSADHNITLLHLKSLACVKQFVGFTDEVLDLAFVGKAHHLAVATNSPDIKLYDRAMGCQLLKGHSDIVLCLSSCKSNPDLLLSGSKDHRIKLWQFDGATMTCVATGLRHTGPVGSVSFANTSSDLCVSVSQDTCLKLWHDLNNTNLTCVKTEKAHLKDINCVSISPNDKIIATASQDKTAKLWTDSLTLVGTLRGHRRGVWSVHFSPVDQVVLTASADCTIKLWSVVELNCLKTLEGHESSVLHARFISDGMQILTGGADGLIKLFSVKSSECVATLDQHEGRVWALALTRDESGLVSGGSDSLVIKWRDVTEDRRVQRVRAQEEEQVQLQLLANHVHDGRLLEAVQMALRLNRPLQVLKIVQSMGREATGLAEVVRGLDSEQKERLLRCASDWNTNSRNCEAAHLVLNVLLREMQSGDFRPLGLGGMVEGALPYTERHFKRLTRLLQELHLVTYTVNCMQPHVKNS